MLLCRCVYTVWPNFAEQKTHTEETGTALCQCPSNTASADLCWDERTSDSLSLDVTGCWECSFVHSLNPWISFTENIRFFPQLQGSRNILVVFKPVKAYISPVLNQPVHLNSLWNETTTSYCFWCITWVWTDETACTSILKTPLCPSTHLIGGVCDGTFCDRKEIRESLSSFQWSNRKPVYMGL